MKYHYIILLIIAFTNCKNTITQKMDKKDYLELDKCIGTDTYEVLCLLSNNYGIHEFENNLGRSYFFIDTKQNRLILDCTEHLKDKNKYNVATLTNYGKYLKNYTNNSFKLLSDGTLWKRYYYSKALINGDETKHLYVDPFSNKEIDDIYNVTVNEKLEDWYQKFKELYQKATIVKNNLSRYYLKVDDIWYFIDGFDRGEELKIDIKKEYPEKSTIKRMLPLQKEIIKFYLPPEERTNKILEEIDYESAYYEEKDNGLITSNYSAGWWYLHINMPNDTIKIKRYASYKNPKMTLFKIPKEYGGSNEVLFIVLESSSMHKEQKAGLYVVRSKNYKQLPEYKPFLEKEQRDSLKNRRSFTN